jgi:hypothetical protein
MVFQLPHQNILLYNYPHIARLPSAGVLPILHPVCIVHTILHHNNGHIYLQVLDRDDLKIQHTSVAITPAPSPARSGREVDTNLGYRLHNPVLPEGDRVDYYLDNTSRFGRVLGATDFLYNNCNQNVFLLFCIYTGS